MKKLVSLIALGAMLAGTAATPPWPGAGQRSIVIAAGAAKHGVPFNILCYNRLPQVIELARRNPNTQFVIDHVGLTQPFEPPPLAEPWKDIENVLKAATMPSPAGAGPCSRAAASVAIATMPSSTKAVAGARKS